MPTLTKLLSYPVLNDSYSTATSYYSWFKEKSPRLISGPLSLSEATLQKLAQLTLENGFYQKNIAPTVDYVDETLEGKIDHVAQNYPLVKKTKEELYNDYLKDGVEYALCPAKYTYDSVSVTYHGSRDRLLQSYAALNSYTLKVLNCYLDKVLPPVESMEEEQNKLNFVLLIKRAKNRSIGRATLKVEDAYSYGLNAISMAQANIRALHATKSYIEGLNLEFLTGLRTLNESNRSTDDTEKPSSNDNKIPDLDTTISNLKKQISKNVKFAYDILKVVTSMVQSRLSPNQKANIDAVFQNVLSVMSLCREVTFHFDDKWLERIRALLGETRTSYETLFQDVLIFFHLNAPNDRTSDASIDDSADASKEMNNIEVQTTNSSSGGRIVVHDSSSSAGEDFSTSMFEVEEVA